jgi:arginyl-tRNA--protein-N-Asp/Glu arginylyltransferase
VRVVFSECCPDYPRYLFPYQIWAYPEKGDLPSALLARGFLPSQYNLSRYYLARSVRVSLADFHSTARLRQIGRSCAAVRVQLVPKAEFSISESAVAMCQEYTAARWSSGMVARERLERLFQSAITTHVLCFTSQQTGHDVGWVTLYVEPSTCAFYSNAFYDIAWLDRSLGRYMMLSAAEWCASASIQYLYLGTCYSEQSLYKVRHPGCEFFNGFRWSSDLQELRYLISRQSQEQQSHLFETAEYVQAFCEGSADQRIMSSKPLNRID